MSPRSWATWALLAGALSACDGGEATQRGGAGDGPSAKLPGCAAYRGNPNTWGYCVYKLAGGFPTLDDVEALCPTSGEWEQQCRHAWVAGRMAPNSGVSTEDLLTACGPDNHDCSFELIDFRASDVVDEQIALCREHAGPDHSDDCIGHAMQRWWMSKPDADEVARVAALDIGEPRQVGFFVAASVFCAGVGACDGHPDNAAICRTQVDIFSKRPETCPPQEWQVMGHNQGRGAPKGPGPVPPGSTSGPGTPPGDPPAGGQAPGTQPPSGEPAPRHQPGTIPPPR